MRWLCVLTLFLFPTLAHAWPAKIAEVTDGDTVIVLPAGDKNSPMPVRLYGVDAPETGQEGGEAARAQLAALLPVRTRAEVMPMSTDKYGRVVVLVARRGVVVNGLMVSSGHAWVEKRFCRARICRRWQKEQREAKKERRGLWAEEKPTAPWVWRRNQER